MRLTNSVVFASQNRKKWEELKAILEPYSVELIPASEFIRNPEKLAASEIHDTYLENAAAKARLANLASHYPSLGDDSGLEVQALEGKPGVKSARFSIPKMGETQDQANVQKLLSELKKTSASPRTARFRTVLALVIEGLVLTGEGTLEGTITESPKGTMGFGYDPVFIPNGETRTLAEMRPEEKNAFSHRAMAAKNLMLEIEKNGISLARP